MQSSHAVSLAATPDDAPTILETVEAFKAGMRLFASGVTLITAEHEGLKAGLIATAVNSVTMDPPTLLVCVNKSASAHSTIDNSNSLCVNLLSLDHSAILEVFSSSTRKDERFKDGEWKTLSTGCPILSDSVASFDCNIIERMHYGTHTIFLAQVEAVHLSGTEIEPVLYMDRAYRKLHPLL